MVDVDERFGVVKAIGQVKAVGIIFVVRSVLAWIDQVAECGLGI